MQTCAGRTQWISSPSPYPLGHDYGNVSFPTRLTQAATSHPVEVGFTMLTLGTHSTASFLGLSYLSHSVHFFGHEIGCTWALPHDFARLLLFAAGQLSWLQEGSTWLQRALDTKSSCRMRWQKAESCSRCPTAKCCLDPDSNQVCYSHNAEN